MQQDHFFPLLWRLIKVVWRYVRMAYATFFGAIALLNLCELRFGAAILGAFLAWLIWPGSIRRLTKPANKTPQESPL